MNWSANHRNTHTRTHFVLWTQRFQIQERGDYSWSSHGSRADERLRFISASLWMTWNLTRLPRIPAQSQPAAAERKHSVDRSVFICLLPPSIPGSLIDSTTLSRFQMHVEYLSEWTKSSTRNQTACRFVVNTLLFPINWTHVFKKSDLLL